MKLPAYRGSHGTSINMTPMIDVTFLLIIFFLVSSHIAKQDQRLPLDLPLSNTGLASQILADRPTTTVHVLPDGTYHLGSNPLPLANIIEALKQRNANTPGGLRVRIRTDKSVAYEYVSPLLKACAELTIRDVVFSVYEDLRVGSSRDSKNSLIAYLVNPQRGLMKTEPMTLATGVDFATASPLVPEASAYGSGKTQFSSVYHLNHGASHAH